jgi:hypothetical protein
VPEGKGALMAIPVVRTIAARHSSSIDKIRLNIGVRSNGARCFTCDHSLAIAVGPLPATTL